MRKTTFILALVIELSLVMSPEIAVDGVRSQRKLNKLWVDYVYGCQ